MNADIDAVYQQIPDVACKGLCSNSCGPIDMSPVERARISATNVGIPRPGPALKLLVDAGDYTCPALKDGACTIHDVRPAICRMWGTVKSLPCPHGCTPEPGFLSDKDAFSLLNTLNTIKR